MTAWLMFEAAGEVAARVSKSAAISANSRVATEAVGADTAGIAAASKRAVSIGPLVPWRGRWKKEWAA